MKIFAIGRNYVEHIEELGNEQPNEPVVFTKPDTALLKNNAPFYIPAFSQNIHHEVEVLIKICREGKFIDQKFAHKYFDQIGIGIDFTARDWQQRAKEKGLPWAIAKGFNGAAPVSEFLPIASVEDIHNLNFGLEIDGELKQKGNTKLMIFKFEALIAYLSRFFTLKRGDIIFTGTPKGVGTVKAGDRLRAFIEDKILLDFEVK